MHQVRGNQKSGSAPYRQPRQRRLQRSRESRDALHDVSQRIARPADSVAEANRARFRFGSVP